MWLDKEFLFFNVFMQTGHCRAGVAVCMVSMCRIPLLLVTKSLKHRRQRQALLRSPGSDCTKLSSRNPEMQSVLFFYMS